MKQVIRVVDKWNSAKTWIITRHDRGELKLNQEVCGNMILSKATRVNYRYLAGIGQWLLDSYKEQLQRGKGKAKKTTTMQRLQVIDDAIDAYKGKLRVEMIMDNRSVMEHELDAIIENLEEYNPEIAINEKLKGFIRAELKR